MPVKFFGRTQRRDPRTQDNTRMFGIGHGKTGTKSLVKAARILGYDLMHHWGDIDYDELDRRDGGADNAFSARFVELDQMYPGSKFIYTNRRLEDWLESCKRHIRRKTPQEVGSPKYDNRVRMYGYDHGLGYREELLAEAYTRHKNQVLDYFQNRSDDLLIINIIDGEGWEKLCPFLDVPIPTLEFPHVTGNKISTRLLRRARRIFRSYLGDYWNRS